MRLPIGNGRAIENKGSPRTVSTVSDGQRLLGAGAPRLTDPPSIEQVALGKRNFAAPAPAATTAAAARAAIKAGEEVIPSSSFCHQGRASVAGPSASFSLETVFAPMFEMGAASLDTDGVVEASFGG